MKCLLLVLLVGVVSAADFASTRLIPAPLRHGNRYYIEVDNVGSHFIFKPIAVYSTGKRVYFGEFSDDADCTVVAGLSNVHQACEYQHFMLHGNDRFHRRHELHEYLSDKLKCDPVQIGDSILLLIKHDVQNPRSEKYIGTYMRDRDMAFYIGHNNKRVVHRRLWRDMQKKRISTQKFEVMCELFLDQAKGKTI